MECLLEIAMTGKYGHKLPYHKEHGTPSLSTDVPLKCIMCDFSIFSAHEFYLYFAAQGLEIGNSVYSIRFDQEFLQKVPSMM